MGALHAYEADEAALDHFSKIYQLHRNFARYLFKMLFFLFSLSLRLLSLHFNRISLPPLKALLTYFPFLHPAAAAALRSAKHVTRSSFDSFPEKRQAASFLLPAFCCNLPIRMHHCLLIHIRASVQGPKKYLHVVGGMLQAR